MGTESLGVTLVVFEKSSAQGNRKKTASTPSGHW